MTHKGFVHTIEKFGMEVVDPQGQPFNPQQHEAMGMQENAELPANTVLYVMQKGLHLERPLVAPSHGDGFESARITGRKKNLIKCIEIFTGSPQIEDIPEPI